MFLSNIRIFYKVLIVSVTCSLVTLAVAGTGYFGVSRLHTAIGAIVNAAQDARTAAHLNQIVLTLNRAEFLLAADPSSDSLRETQRRIDDQRTALETALGTLKGRADSEQKGLLEAIEAGHKAYLRAQNDTIEKVRNHGAKVEVSEDQMIITDAAMTGSTVAGKLEKAVRTYADNAEERATHISDLATQLASTTQTLMVAVTVLGLAGGLVLGIQLGHVGISKPITAVANCLRRLAEGDAEVAVFGLGRRDEIGTIAGTLGVFKESIQRNRLMEREAEATAQRTAAEKRLAMTTLADSLETSVQAVIETVAVAVGEMKANAEAMSNMSEEASHQAGAVAAAAGRASDNVESVASAAEELTASIGEISRQVSHASTVSAQAVGQAALTTDIVNSLADMASRIGEVVDLINTIAGQTNLLALNATIEAARAGDAGKGFAVVANEVKTLANQTAKATEEIGGQVAAVQNATSRAVQAIQDIGVTIQQISQISASIATAIEQQGAATKEIASNVEQAARGTQDVAANIGGLTHEAQEVGSIAGKVLNASHALAEQSEVLRATVDTFTAQVRTG